MPYILALDQGTTSSRALIVDVDGSVRAVAQHEFRQIFPEPGWVEHDPEELVRSQFDVATEAMARAELGATDLAAIGLTNQRETTIVWDRKSGRAIANAIVWQDRRTTALCEELERRGLGELIRSHTGLELDPYFSATKVRWLLDYVPGAQERAEQGELLFGTVDSWLVWRMTGGSAHVTDATNASRTLLFDIHRGCWDDEILAALRIPRCMLATVVDSSAVIATTRDCDLPDGVPIAAIAGDQQAALFGQRCIHPGMVKTTYGTGSFIMMNTGEKPVASQNRLLTTIAWRSSGVDDFALEGSVFTAGAVIQWLRDGLGIIASAADVEPLARQVPSSEGVFLVPAFAGLGAPHWDPRARGLLIGITRGTTKAHIARAALEAIAFQVAEVVEAMESDSGLTVSEMRVDGGATVNDLLMQMQADVLGVPIVRSQSAESTALGAAYLAGLATDFWKSSDDLDRLWKRQQAFAPDSTRSTRQSRLAEWRHAVDRAKAWA